ncbi:MAG: type II toxin-antitoxin system PemK/MazF family toxin [Chloroflexota bacterium]|nr:type II toxin-antitoxin system PemK/MazF family toxin [Chloroflexota bacterium]
MAYIPERGDVVWIQLDPQAGREQAGHRPALVLSPQSFNKKLNVVFCCPITSRAKRFEFEVPLPDNLDVKGVVLSHHMKSLDWRARDAKYMTRIPDYVVDDVLSVLDSILAMPKLN